MLIWIHYYWIYRSSHTKVFLGKGILKICSKFTVEHPCWSAISIKFLCNFIEITIQHGCSPVYLLSIFRTPFFKNTSGWLLLNLSRLRHISHCLFYFWKITRWTFLALREQNFSRNHITDLFNQFARKLHNHTLCVLTGKSMTIVVLLYVVMVLLSFSESKD